MSTAAATKELPDQARSGRAISWPAATCAALVVLLLGYWPLKLMGGGWLPLIADDAFYYFIIAKHLAGEGRSTFDGQVLTNGYHPLWQFLLALQYATLGERAIVTFAVQLGALAGAAFLVFRRIGDWSWFPLLAVMIAGSQRVIAVVGMETAVLFLAFALFLSAFRLVERNRAAWPWLGMAGAAVIAARLDAALFVLPALLLVPLPRSVRYSAIALIGVCGAVYAVINQAVFGAWMPLSGSVKSLGGLQLNRALLVDAMRHLAGPLDQGLFTSLEGRMLLAALAGFLLLALAHDRRNTFAWRLLLAMLVGFAAFAARQLFSSSWILWSWYYFPLFFLLVADFLVIVPLVGDPSVGLIRRIAAAAIVVVLAVANVDTVFLPAMLLWLAACAVAPLLGAARVGIVTRTATFAVGAYIALVVTTVVLNRVPESDRYLAASRTAAETVRGAIGDAHIAMGDRAGAFSYFYGAPVTQLEGLINDTEYFRALTQSRPVKELLCRRGVRFLVQFEPDLGTYATHEASVFNPETTTFPGPAIGVSKADEVLRIVDPQFQRQFPRNPYIYVWRLSGC